MSSSEPPPGEDVFSEDDLIPDFRPSKRPLVERAAATLAVSAIGVWIGGLIALGACAAPFVFKMTPAPTSGFAMGAAFARFDNIAIGCGVVALGCEVVRTLAARSGRGAMGARVRRYVAIAMALGAVYTGVRLSPTINDLHRAGVRRHVGPQGAELERLHKQAEAIGKALVPLGVVLIGLHVFTLPRREEDDATFVAPLPPGA